MLVHAVASQLEAAGVGGTTVPTVEGTRSTCEE